MIADSQEDLFKSHVADPIALDAISFKVRVHLLEDTSKLLRHIIGQFVYNFSSFVDLHCDFLIRADLNLFLHFFYNSSTRLALIMFIGLVVLFEKSEEIGVFRRIRVHWINFKVEILSEFLFKEISGAADLEASTRDYSHSVRQKLSFVHIMCC